MDLVNISEDPCKDILQGLSSANEDLSKVCLEVRPNSHLLVP